MAQVVISGLRASLDVHRAGLSRAVDGAVVEAHDHPPEKRFQRFIGLDPADFVHPGDRGVVSTIIETSMFEGRSGYRVIP